MRVAAYALMIAGAIGLFLLIRSAGSTLVAPVGDAAACTVTAAKVDVLFDVLLSLVAIIVAARLCGALFKRMHQPPVIGKVIAGILLGPSFLGRISPEAMNFVLPPTVAPFLSVIAASSSRSCSVPRWRSGPIPRFHERRHVHDLRALPRRVTVRYGVPRARAHSHGIAGFRRRRWAPSRSPARPWMTSPRGACSPSWSP